MVIHRCVWLSRRKEESDMINNFKLILKRRDEAATFFSVAVYLQSSAPAQNISVKCHNFSESKVKVETGGQKLTYC